MTVAGLSGCALLNHDAENAAAVEQEFFDALAKGDGEAALALTTFDQAGDTACTDLFDTYGVYTSGVHGVKIGQAKASGDSAEVAFTYTLLGLSTGERDVSGSHALVRDGDSWLIQYPEHYRISASVPADVAAQVSVDENFSDAGECVTTLPDGDTFEAFALPGSYNIGVRDPAGVFADRMEHGAEVVVSDAAESGTTAALPFITEDERAQVAIYITSELSDVIWDCATSNFTSTTCPDGLPTDADLADRPNDRLGKSEMAVTSIVSDDNQTWRFTASGKDFLFERDGKPEVFPIEYSGAVVAPKSTGGAAQIVLD